ncbi:MAG: MarR family winged helix-turn-helix transcriptional regulator [Oscillospiraceae bacterium]
MRAKGKYIVKATDYNQLMVKNDASIESVNKASFLFASAVYREMDKIGIRPSYRNIMKSLCENESLTQLELVKITNLKAPTISITLRSMERDGIVSRVKNDIDRRETHVAITDKGRKMYQKMLASIEKIQKKMTCNLTAEETEQVSALMKKMCDNLGSEAE